MKKCDVCPYSDFEDGKLICRYFTCKLENETEIRKEVYKVLKGEKNKWKDF